MVIVYFTFVITGNELRELERKAKHAQAHAFATGTFENYQSQWVTYLAFCIKFGLVALPASTLVLIWFVQFLTRKLKAHGSLTGYLSGIKKLHLFTRQSTRSFHSFLLKLTLRGMRRLNNYVSKQALPITRRLLEAMHAQLDHNDEFDVVFWCACIMGFFLLFRKSNLVPDSRWGFDPNKQLKRMDLV